MSDIVNTSVMFCFGNTALLYVCVFMTLQSDNEKGEAQAEESAVMDDVCEMLKAKWKLKIARVHNRR